VFGVLALGIGDALVSLLAGLGPLASRGLTIPLSPPAQASIVGRRIGRLTWSTSSGKTLEGSAAFWASVVVSGGILWAVGAVGQVDVREKSIPPLLVGVGLM
jgi:hypothetical protein